MTPSQQRLKSSDRSGAHIDQWLIEQLKLPGLERFAKVEFEQAPRLHLRVHFGLEQSVDGAAVDLRAIQRQIGILQELITVRPVLRGKGNADAGACHDLVASHVERCVEQLKHPVGESDCLGRLLDRRQDDGELVATQPRHGVRFTRVLHQPFCDDLQQRIANRMSERVVDLLELVEVQVQQRQPLPTTGMRECCFQLMMEQHTVRQVGQSVMVREVYHPGFRRAAVSDLLVCGEPTFVPSAGRSC